MKSSVLPRGFAFLCACMGVPAVAQVPAIWTEPFPPHKIAGNLYYIGSRDLASYLITTSEGHILINSSLEESVPLIRTSVEKLGFKFTDVKVLLISHAHADHCAGSAEIKKLTGAIYMVMEGDVPAVESGGAPKKLADYTQFPPAKVDRVLHDGDEVKLGDAVLVAHLTPGHTRGCTTWTMRVLDAVIIGSPNVNPGYILVNNKTYPEIAIDYEKCFRALHSLPVNLFLGAHGSYYDMQKKHALLPTAATNPFIDPDGYHRYVTEREQAFRGEWEKQRAKLASHDTNARSSAGVSFQTASTSAGANHCVWNGPRFKRFSGIRSGADAAGFWLAAPGSEGDSLHTHGRCTSTGRGSLFRLQLGTFVGFMLGVVRIAIRTPSYGIHRRNL